MLSWSVSSNLSAFCKSLLKYVSQPKIRKKDFRDIVYKIYATLTSETLRWIQRVRSSFAKT